MKKIVIIAMALVLLSPMLVLAEQGQGNQSSDQGNDDAGEQYAEPMLISAQTRTRAQTSEELQQMIQQRQQEMNQELEGLGSAQQNVYQNQNQVRLAVHALLAMEDLAGNRGQQIAAVAREFNNSVQATIQAEEKIQNRFFLTTLFMGGDSEAAGEIEAEVNQNQARITNLKTYMNECDCGSEVKAMLQEQIQNMEQEQERLGELAQNENQNKGLFGWLFR